MRYPFFYPLIPVVLLLGCSPQNAPQNTAPAQKKSASPERETWDVLFIQGSRVGHVQTSFYRETLDGQPIERIECRNEIKVKRSGQTAEMKISTTSFEKPGGELLRFENVMEIGPQPTRTTGRVVGKRLEMETLDQGRKRSAEMPWSPQYGGFNALEQSLLRKPMQPGERRTLELLQPDFIQIQRVTMELLAREWVHVELPGGPQELLRIEGVTILSDGQKTRQTYWTDRHGEPLKAHSKEMDIDIYRTTKAEALKKDAGRLYDINIQTAVRLDQPIPNAHETKKIRYRLHLEDGDPAKVFPVGATQQIKSIDANTAELTVYSIQPGEKGGNPAAPADPPSDADRKPNNMLQSDDPRVVSLAEEAAGKETDPWKTAIKLEKFVREYITAKNFSQVLDSAAEVAKTREGDCTEHAALLAAMCRARNIPARGAVGLVYTERRTKEGPERQIESTVPEFAYHMWVEAYIDGRWIPLDALFGRGGIGAAHILVARTSLKDNSIYSSFLPVAQVVGKLKIEVLETE